MNNIEVTLSAIMMVCVMLFLDMCMVVMYTCYPEFQMLTIIGAVAVNVGLVISGYNLVVDELKTEEEA